MVAMSGNLGEALATPTTGYSVVYHIEIGLLFATLIILGRLISQNRSIPTLNQKPTGLGLADFPT
jgi:BCD family chlorophyll transporter-like MFS transporter